MKSKKRTLLQVFGILDLAKIKKEGLQELQGVLDLSTAGQESCMHGEIAVRSHACMEKSRWHAEYARVYLRVRRGDMPSYYSYQIVLSNCWRLFFLILSKLDGCQVEIANSWRCSEWIIRNSWRRPPSFLPTLFLRSCKTLCFWEANIRYSWSILYEFCSKKPMNKQIDMYCL
jgi:hypothetical protein